MIQSFFVQRKSLVDKMRSPDFIEFDTLHYSYGDMFAKHFLAQVIIKFQYDIECLKLLNTLFRNLILSFFTHSKCLVKHTAKRTQFLLQISICFLYTSHFFYIKGNLFSKEQGKGVSDMSINIWYSLSQETLYFTPTDTTHQ